MTSDTDGSARGIHMSPEDVRAALSKALERELAFLRELGFEFKGVTEEVSEVLGRVVRGHYTNGKVNRVVCVTYLPKGSGPREVATTNITLVTSEPADDFDYTSTGNMEVCATDLSALAGDLGARLEQHLRLSERALREKFMKVLHGRFWQSDHLDWGDLK
jgi:hypothetical protein